MVSANQAFIEGGREGRKGREVQPDGQKLFAETGKETWLGAYKPLDVEQI